VLSVLPRRLGTCLSAVTAVYYYEVCYFDATLALNCGRSLRLNIPLSIGRCPLAWEQHRPPKAAASAPSTWWQMNAMQLVLCRPNAMYAIRRRGQVLQAHVQSTDDDSCTFVYCGFAVATQQTMPVVLLHLCTV